MSLHHGFRLVQNYQEGEITYTDERGCNLEVSKSNSMSKEYVETVLCYAGISVDDFKAEYKRAYSDG